jgi:hypothetical protein
MNKGVEEKKTIVAISETVRLELVGSGHTQASTRQISNKDSSKDLLARARASSKARGQGREERCLGCKLLGLRGLACLTVAVAICGLLLYAYFQFTARPWYILFVAALALCVPLKFTYLLCSSPLVTTKSEKGRCSRILAVILDTYDEVGDPDGKYYVSKTYASEVGEYIAQVFAIQVYACSFPVWLAVMFYAFIAVEAFGITIDTYWTLNHGLTVRRRNNRIMADILLDVLSSTIPILIMRFGYVINFTELEFVQIALVPAIFALQKIHEITEAILRERAIQYRFLKKKSKRLSFFVHNTAGERDENEVVAQMQMKHTPRWQHLGIGMVSLTYGVFLASLVIGQLVMQPSIQCSVGAVNKKVWDSCAVQVPFCKHLFSPSCDCVVLRVQQHNWTALPAMVHGMTAMKTIVVNHGPLMQASGLTGLAKLRRVNLNYNHLASVPGELGSLHVTRLELANNRLLGLPAALWKSPYLIYLDLSTNSISKVEPDIQKSNLQTLYFANNSLSGFPLDILQVQSLKYLFLDGNHIPALPSNIGDLNQLIFFTLHNNLRIQIIPKSIGNMMNLEVLDIRNNNVSFLPNAIESLKRLRYMYLENNPICSNGWMAAAKNKGFVEKLGSLPDGGGRCSKQCSPYCADDALKDRRCLRECNSKACKFQNGVCDKK